MTELWRRVNGYLIKVGPSSVKLGLNVGVRTRVLRIAWNQGEGSVVRIEATQTRRRVAGLGSPNFRVCVCSRRCHEELARSELRRRPVISTLPVSGYLWRNLTLPLAFSSSCNIPWTSFYRVAMRKGEEKTAWTKKVRYYGLSESPCLYWDHTRWL